MERLFTERQWRAIAELERLRDWDGYDGFNSEKRIYGPAFAVGEFYLRVWLQPLYAPPYGRDGREIGPPAPRFWVHERTSGLRMSWFVPDRAAAISAARRRLTDCPPDILARMMEKGRELVAEENAKREAQEAIAKARADAKAARKKKVGRRRREIFAADNGRCHYCHTDLVLTGDWHVDHKMPKALGGTNDVLNLVAACTRCNQVKRDKTDIEFKAILAALILAQCDGDCTPVAG